MGKVLEEGLASIEQGVANLRQQFDAVIDHLDERTKHLKPGPKIANAEEKKFLEERGWKEGYGRFWTGTYWFDGEMWEDMAPPPGRREVTHEIDVPDENNRGKMRKKAVELFVSGGNRGVSYPTEVALQLERKRNREPLPPLSVKRVGTEWRIFDRHGFERPDLGIFLTKAEADAWQASAAKPTSCSWCGEQPNPKLRTEGEPNSYTTKIPRLSSEGIRIVAESIWRHESGNLYTDKQPPADVVAQTAKSERWFITPYAKRDQHGNLDVGDVVDLRTGTQTVTVHRCSDPRCQQWPARYGLPPATAIPPQPGVVG
jgi:hypothetical protein